jgi:hypothetical protein
MTRISTNSVLLILLLGLFFNASCRKEADTIAEIQILDAGNNPVSGINVRLHSPTGSRIDVTVQTDAQGLARINFADYYELGQGGFAVLDIEIDGGPCVSIIEIVEEETNTKIIACDNL